MDMTKTMEVLRRMKFMQRVEEAKRRELFEADQRRQMEERMHSKSSNGMHSGVSPPPLGMTSDSLPLVAERKVATIISSVSFPRELYSVSRMSFCSKAAISPNEEAISEVREGERSKVEKHMDEKKKINLDHLNKDAEKNLSEGEEDSYDMEDVTAVRYDDRKDRFCVKSNAPPLPKALSRKVKAKKRRREEDQE
ncbi:unnamed protein product [Trypanosoma congolense IL3000]|uniref:WGS project CAEQ00000000 data, annotated contig 2137 n=1 Tax=Trypanosoma congolense (strain IL3000) TaxID=1068625 RepID=F9WBR0_TRYCI|nr:unnamed protein product [Trypanosoma congolense IL3000]